MKDLAILIDRPGYSQKFRLMAQELNKLNTAAPDINLTVYYCEPGPIPIEAKFPMMDLVHGYGTKAVLISTDLATTYAMNNFLCPKDRFFYVWDLEYIYQPYSFSILSELFKNKLLARNKFRYDVLKSTWSTPHLIIEDFNHEQLIKLL